MCVSALPACTPVRAWCLGRSEEDARSPGTEITGGCALPCRCWELELGSFARSASALSSWAISPAPVVLSHCPLSCCLVLTWSGILLKIKQYDLLVEKVRNSTISYPWKLQNASPIGTVVIIGEFLLCWGCFCLFLIGILGLDRFIMYSKLSSGGKWIFSEIPNDTIWGGAGGSLVCCIISQNCLVFFEF